MHTEAQTLSGCNNNICTFLMKHQENVLNIDHLRGDGIMYNPQHFTTLVFDDLVKTNCPDFLDDVKV